MKPEEFISKYKEYLDKLSPNTNIDSWTYLRSKKSKKTNDIRYTFSSNKNTIELNFESKNLNITPWFISADKKNVESWVHHLQIGKSGHYAFSGNTLTVQDNCRVGGGRTEKYPDSVNKFKKGLSENGFKDGVIYSGKFSGPEITHNILNWSVVRKGLNDDFYEKSNTIRKLSRVPSGEDTDKKRKNNTPYGFTNFILYGPPGTGKTYNTIDIATSIIANKSIFKEDGSIEDFTKTHDDNYTSFTTSLGKIIHFITFHQNYSYEEFIGGLRPDESQSMIAFKWKPGIFIKACAAAYILAKEESEGFNKKFNELETVDNKEDQFWQDLTQKFFDYCRKQKTIDNDFNKDNRIVLIIDEINRANISRVFGELITLIEDDKRIGGEHQLIVSLPNGKQFGVPKNLVIIGTMNTADKSIALIDIALRRRFEFILINPNRDLVSENYRTFFENLNKNIYEEKESNDYSIGHSYLMNDKDGNIPDFKRVMNKKIIPLLYEYFMGDDDKIFEILDKSKPDNFDYIFTNQTYLQLIKCEKNG